MAIRWFNIRSKEERVAVTEPQISAMWASSDHSPNITQGQDFGWRLAPEVVVQMKQIKQDFTKLQEIAVRLGRPLEDVGEKEILAYISSQTPVDTAPIAEDGDYTDQYEQAIRDLESAGRGEAVGVMALSTDELEAELAKRKAGSATEQTATTTTTTTEAPSTTTTTTEKPAPSTTTTTTKKQ